MLYVDDGAFTFPSWKELEISSAVVRQQFAKFGLEMHVGSATKASKTEAVFFPAPGFFKLPPLPPSEDSSSTLPLVTKPKQENDVTKWAREDKSYDELQETQPVILPDGGIITFCRHFKYLGNFISYSLRDDYDIDHRLSQASSEMGALQHFWGDDAVDIHSKYLIYCAIPLNLLLWGCESWALRATMMSKLEVFFHRSIRRILGITITQVIDEHITNDSVWMRFCRIPSLQNQITKRQLTFIGKVVRNSDDQIPTRLLTAWCNHPRRRGAPLQSNKKSLVRNLQLIVPSVPKDGRLSSWALYALDGSYWNHLVSQLGTQPTDWEGEVPGAANYTAPPPPQGPPRSPPRNRAPPPPSPRRSSTSSPPVPSPPPQRRPPPPSSQNSESEWNYDPNGVGRNRRDSFGILQLNSAATEREIKVQYRRLARIYHPDKYDGSTNPMTKEQSQEHFKLINNAYEFLRTN